MSESITLGGCGAALRESSASVAEAKLRKSMPSRPIAFSSTQRMERSSSMIQTVFIYRILRTILVRNFGPCLNSVR